VPLLDAPPGPPGRQDSVRRLLFRTPLGYVFWAALLARGAMAWLQGGATASLLVDTLTVVSGLALAVSLVLVLIRFWGIARRRLLWRVRRKLILSYVFIGVVPVILVVAFFLFAGAVMFLHVSAYLFKRGFDDLVDEATVLAQTAAAEVQRGGLENADQVLARKVANGSARYPGISVALVLRPSSARASATPVTPRHAGPWLHSDPPGDVPPWVSTGGFGALLAYSYGEEAGEPQVVVRAVSFPDERDPAYGIVIDIPVDEQVQAWLRENTGITLSSVGVLALGDDSARPAIGRARDSAPQLDRSAGPAQRWVLTSLTFFDYVDWVTGRTGTLAVGMRVSVGELYDRLQAAQSRLGRVTLGELFLVVLVVVAGLFLIIEVAALVMGFALARSITGAIHQLFDGTQRVREGDFAHRIEVRTRDQLGELAESFNQMTGSIEALLHQAEEKRRLEEELRIAREIQMSLLPRGPVALPGVSVTGLCVPAREVGGDYYDFFPLDDHRLGILIADVAGKGTSAALYMAELKGLLLSLSRIHESPKPLLSQVNRVLADNLDSRSFITMTYAIVDLRRKSLVYARAGHTPLLHYTVCAEGRRTVASHAPDGIVLGLRIEGVAARFDQILTECTIALAPGDTVVFYTDGISEAMNPASDLFGEERLQDLVAEFGHLPSEELRDRILSEVEAFVGDADQHDDMTMILLRMDPEPTQADAAPVRPGLPA
jgi:sigma-B regulation protein RsbU (phosphoserine phosphatase)